MLDYIKNNAQVLILFFVWLILGKYVPILSFVVIPISFILLSRRKLDTEILIGFIFILILSDNHVLTFAAKIKPIIILFLTLYIFTNSKKVENKIFPAFILFFIYSLSLLYKSTTLLTSLQKNISYVFLFYSIPILILKAFSIKKTVLLRNLIFFLTIILVINFILRIVSPTSVLSHGGRLRGIFGNPNGLGIFCVLVFILFKVCKSHFNEIFTRNETILIQFIIFLTAVLTASRTSIIGILIFLLFSKIKSPIIGFILMIFVSISYNTIIDFSLATIKQLGLSKELRVEKKDKLDTGSGRLVAWKFAWNEIQKNITFGKGWAYDEYLFSRPKVKLYLNALNHQGGVHNVYLIFWLNTGFIGLFLFFGALFIVFFKASKVSSLALPFLYSSLFISNFEPWLTASLNPYTILFLIILTIILSIPKENESIQIG